MPQYHTYPSRSHSYIQSGLPPAYYNETDDRLGTLRDLINEYNVARGANRRFDIIRDMNDDDEIFV